MKQNYLKKSGIAMLAFAMLVSLSASGQSTQDEGWIILFNGENLDGWEFRGGGDMAPTFNVEDGTIVGHTLIPRNTAAYLATKEQFKDFELVFEVKIDEGLNSGVQVRSTPARTMVGPQVEIESGSHKTGYIFGQGMGTSYFDVDLPEENVTFIKNKWNKFRVLVMGNNIKTWINDVQLADLSSDKFAPEGVIALQVHGYPRGSMFEKGSDVVLTVALKNIKIREIPTD